VCSVTAEFLFCIEKLLKTPVCRACALRSWGVSGGDARLPARDAGGPIERGRGAGRGVGGTRDRRAVRKTVHRSTAQLTKLACPPKLTNAPRPTDKNAPLWAETRATSWRGCVELGPPQLVGRVLERRRCCAIWVTGRRGVGIDKWWRRCRSSCRGVDDRYGGTGHGVGPVIGLLVQQDILQPALTQLPTQIFHLAFERTCARQRRSVKPVPERHMPRSPLPPPPHFDVT
jgi:hypothetical protein